MMALEMLLKNGENMIRALNKWGLLIAVFITAVACGPADDKASSSKESTSNSPTGTTHVAPEDTIFINRITNDVSILTSGKARNYENLEALNKAADYISGEFEKTGGKVSEQPFEVEGNIYKNIICSFGPEDGERIILGAHYDVCGKQKGADDNASGIAGILEIARMIGAKKPTLQYRIDVVAYTLEEPPFFRSQHMGSAVHAKYIQDEKIPLKVMVCLEMIGYFSDEKGSQEYPMKEFEAMYPTVGNYIALVGGADDQMFTNQFKADMNKASSIDVQTINAPPSVQGLDYSDHLNYWNYDYQAMMVTNTGFYRNKNYHEKTDTKETLDYNRMYLVIKGVYNALVSIK
jgi:hypothetical protein